MNKINVGKNGDFVQMFFLISINSHKPFYKTNFEALTLGVENIKTATFTHWGQTQT